MNKKNNLKNLGVILAVLMAFGLTQSAWAVTVTSTGSGLWSDAGTWDVGVPTADDDVIIATGHTVTVDIDGVCKSLEVQTGGTATFVTPQVDSEVTLIVLGDITINDADDGIQGINGTGRLNITIGDESDPGSATACTIEQAGAADGSVGFNVNDLKLYNASVTYQTAVADDAAYIYGDLTLSGTSTLTPGAIEMDWVFYGGSNATQTVTVSDDSFVNFYALTTDNSANVVANGNITCSGIMTITNAADSFVQNSGDFTISTGAATTPVNNGTLEYFNLYINNTDLVDPATSFAIKGDLYKLGSAAFTPTGGTVTFQNVNEKQIVVSQGDLSFWDMVVETGTRIRTNSSFEIIGTGANEGITTVGDGSFIAETGTITFNAAGAQDITNAADGTLEFFNLASSGGTTVNTSSDFTIKGNLSLGVGDDFIAGNGSNITFDNVLERTIDNQGGAATDMQFFKITVADGAKVNVAANDDRASFVISGVEAAGESAGIEIQGTGQFSTVNAGTAYGTITFDGNAASYDKNIVVSDDGTLIFHNVIVENTAGNNVATADDFTVKGDFSLATAGDGSFTASSPSTITFDDDAAHALACDADGQLIVHNLVIDNQTVTLADENFLHITGDLTINDAAGQFITSSSAGAGNVTFNGTSQQVIGGNSTAANPVVVARLTINKGTAPFDEDDDEVLINLTGTKTVENIDDLNSVIVLTNGILNLGTSTLLVGDDISRTNGYINGNQGTVSVESANLTTLDDQLFTDGNGDATLYNLIINDAAAALAGTLTVNGTITLSTDFVITGEELILNGPVDGGANQFVYTTATSATSKITLDGSGDVDPFDNNLFYDGAANLAPSLEIRRDVALDGNLTLNSGDAGDQGSILIINTGVNYFDLGANTLAFGEDLTIADNATVKIISGSMDASDATVQFNNLQLEVPANIFKNNTIENITFGTAALASDIDLLGDLIVEGTMTHASTNDIFTNGNTLTFMDGSTDPAWDADKHVVGTFKQQVTNLAAATFPVGDGTLYRPVTLQFESLGSSQYVSVTNVEGNATYGRDGIPGKASKVYWNIEQEGTTPDDNLQATLQIPGGDDPVDGYVNANAFNAVWTGSSWTGYYNSDNNVAGAPRQVITDGFVIDAEDLTGVWSIFSAAAATNESKQEAIEVTTDKLVITDIDPNPVQVNLPMSVTVQLQDYLGNPKAVSGSALQVNLSKAVGSGNMAGTTTGIIPVGSNSVVITGVAYDADEPGVQILAKDNAAAKTAGISAPIDVLPVAPAGQGSGLTFSNIQSTSVDVEFNLPGANENAILVVRAGSQIEDLPVDGTTYYANSIFGAGSSIGEGSVVYKVIANTADPINLTVTGLAPNTDYYFRIFTYDGNNGNEAYNSIVGAFTARKVTTTGSNDDDAEFGNNDTWANAKPIGTNTPVKGTIDSETDVDWYSFSVTNAAPNVRMVLQNLPANYNVELYDADQRRIRRGIRLSTSNEAQVINSLPAGTYTVRVYGNDGAYSEDDTSDYYILKVSTFTDEIFSVTP